MDRQTAAKNLAVTGRRKPATEKTEYVVGIDTGGTYTDGVLLDYRTREIISCSKTLTTRENLAYGITRALKDLRIKDTTRIRLVGVSSTLATNSIAEKKTRNAGLLLIGYDPDLMATYNLESKFPTRYVAYFKGGHTSQGLEKEPLDLSGIRAWLSKYGKEVDALAVSGYFSPLDPSHEDRAYAMIRKRYALPVVLGHQLSSKLDSIKRATTACLNAALVAIMQEFIVAVRSALADRGIHAPLMIVKGDGSLIPYTDAVHRPVETVLSGPAASAIGGPFLSGQGSALVIDVGGTTTDLALVDNYKTTLSETGARVGTFETAVKAALIRTAGIGCDSRISLDADGKVQVGPDRAVPLSRLAARFPRVEKEICDLRKKRELEKRSTDIEYWLLYKNVSPGKGAVKNKRLRKLLALLEEGPLNLTEILKKMEVYHALQLNANPLLQQGIIERATLTPTDLLHVNGQMDTWCVEAARQAVEYACTLHANNPLNFVEDTLNLMVASMVEEAIVFLGGQVEDDNLPDRVDGSWGRWLVREAITGSNSYLKVTIASRYPVIGIGAPAGIFIKRVAKLMHTRFILPNHAPVGNAVGAVAGSVIVEKEAIVYPRESRGTCIHVVQIEGENTDFSEDEEAIDYAVQTVTNLAQAGAVAAGAVTPHVMVERSVEGNLQRIVARGIGNPKL